MPGPLTAGQLTFLQGIAAGMLDLTANTTRNTASATAIDQYGSPVEIWTAVLTAVACSMGDPAPTTMQLYPQAFIGVERRVKISFPVGSDVKRNDRITTGGRTYRVEMDIGRDSFSLLGQFIAMQVNEVVF